jgi:tetratricopeptide (TPR) repeat protein
VARGTQHLKKRPAQQARPVERSRSERRRVTRADEAGMFFPMLRRQAKWVFVLLVLVFAGGFVFFGVGSGSTGLGDILNGWLNRSGGSGGPSISKLEAKTRAEPKNAKAFRDLATAYETDQRNEDAIVALERYSELRPKDVESLQELAGLYQRGLQDLSTQAQVVQATAPVAATGLFQPSSTTGLGKAYAESIARDPVTEALQSQIDSQMTDLRTKAGTIQQKLLAVDRRVVRLDPTDPTSQFQLAQVADSTGDTKTAIAAYKRFLVLSPDDPLAAQVKERLKQLAKPASG